ncbi:unnamed protein product [Mytilus edulis]|uniref:Ig-like domain-containing protein n=1 Tax=Mytilus edulis TaxID=6550 RepID=A0A8S3QTT3_MYTED|nr:unnamed protein product [Mytilus edulis]
MSRPVGILLVPILLIYVFHCNAFTWKCPDRPQWFLRADNKCKVKVYSCLYDTEHSTYKEICRKGEDIGREGFKYILTPNPDQVPCAARQYQPFTFTTNGNSQCVFRKSLCKSSGQILANYGNSSTDVNCRCDYRQNYDYIIPPKDPCSCKPPVEDCSCYIRKCDDDEVMIADYRCMKNVETILPEDIRCPIISRKKVPVDIKQFKQVSSSCTWSKQASVILIVVVIIYTVLIGFLFFSVPHVTSILLKSKLKLFFKRKENEFVILNGDNANIECHVKSYLPVRSVTWQKEIDGEIIQITPSKDKYEMVSGKRPSLTITNCNAEDQGKYRCIVRNSIGLRNEFFGSCMNHMSSVSWVTTFMSVLQHIPVFHTEYITLHNYDIDSQSKPTVYNVFKGDDITMEPHFDDQHKLIAVKWFIENDKRTEFDLSDEQYSGSVPDVPSLTIKDTRLENAGKYLCLLIYDNGETQKALIKLKIIPHVKIYKAILKHRGDKTFIRPAVCDTIDKHMRTNNIAIITGREGTGKSKICLELASSYYEKDYMVFKVDLSENHSTYTDIVDTMLIIDDQQYTQDSLSAFMKLLLPVLLERNMKVILTCRNVDLEIVRRVPEIHQLKEEVFIDINSCLTAKEKEEILRSYMKVNDVTSSSSAVNNFRNLEIITDLSVQVTLDENAIKVIRNEETWKGFPLSAMLFCSERKFLHLGEKYFTNPPIYLVEELKELYKTARKILFF